MSRPVLALLALLLVLAAPARAQPPVAVIDGPQTGATGDPVGFDGSGSSDPDGGPLTFAWAIDGRDIDVEHDWLGVAFARPGQHAVRLTVTDTAGETGTALDAISISGSMRADASLEPLGRFVQQGVVAAPQVTIVPLRDRLREHRLRMRVGCRGTTVCRGTLRAVMYVGQDRRVPVLLAQRRFAVHGGAKTALGLRLGARARARLKGRTFVRLTAYRGKVRTASTWATNGYTVRVSRR